MKPPSTSTASATRKATRTGVRTPPDRGTRSTRGGRTRCALDMRQRELARCLAGTGPTSWSLNGKESGVYDLVGNAWEWVDMLIGTTDHTIDAEYPGAGLVLPTANGNIATLYAQRRTATGPSRQTRSLRQRLALQEQSMTMITTGRQPVSVLRCGAGIGSMARTVDCSACTWATLRPARTTTSASAESVDLEIWRSTWYNSTSV